MPPCLALSIKGWIGGKSLRHTSVMSRGCTCTSSCLTLQKQELGSWPMGLMARQGYLLTYLLMFQTLCQKTAQFHMCLPWTIWTGRRTHWREGVSMQPLQSLSKTKRWRESWRVSESPLPPLTRERLYQMLLPQLRLGVSCQQKTDRDQDLLRTSSCKYAQ